jgi:glycosyltransferase involved in cell wall biosynthesis
MKKTVVIRAPLLSMSGYGEHSRQVFKWLIGKKDIDVVAQIVAWGSTPWHINADNLNGLVGEIMNRSVETTKTPDVSVQIQLPNEWDNKLARKNIGLSAWVETDKCNPAWITAANEMTHVVVPSTFVRDVINNTGKLNKPLSVVHESFYSEITEDYSKEVFPLDIETKFNFLIVGQLTANSAETDRKNLINTLKWMLETFSNDPDVGIIIKTNSGTGTTIDRVNTFNLLKGAVEKFRKNQFPKIHLIHGNLTNSEMASIYKNESVKALVTLTRGEGFGLPILEAAAAGLPVVATNWSGHLDFLKLGRFIPVNYTLDTIPKNRVDGHIFIDQSKWAVPDELDFKKKINKFRESPEVPKKWAKDLSEKILSTYSQEAIEAEYEREIGYLFK